MNTTQKIFILVSVISFVIWVLFALDNRIDLGLEYGFDEPLLIISFAIGVGSLVGFFLFKDK